MYLPEPNPSFLFLRFAMCHWHTKSQHLRFSMRYWGKTSLLILVCLKAKTLPVALNMILLSFISKHNCHGTVSQSQFSPPMGITTCLAKLTLQGWPQLCDFSSASTSKQGNLCPISPIQHFTFLTFFAHTSHPDIRKDPLWQVMGSVKSPGTLCTNLFQKRAGLTLRALHFKARCLILDFWIDGLVLRLSAHQFPISRLYFCRMQFME